MTIIHYLIPNKVHAVDCVAEVTACNAVGIVSVIIEIPINDSYAVNFVQQIPCHQDIFSTSEQLLQNMLTYPNGFMRYRQRLRLRGDVVDV